MIRNDIVRRGAWWLFAAALALGAFFFHWPKLDARPMHTDEAVHAIKLGILLETGQYEYDPHEYHGPLIYYAALPFVWATGAKTLADIPNETPLRLPIIIFGALLVAAVALTGSELGRLDAAFAALLIATSPAFSFYSRYYIQEVPFVFFAVIALGAAWKMLQTRRFAWAVIAGAAAGCMVGLKETWIMIAGAAALSAILLHLTTNSRRAPRAINWRQLAGPGAAACAVAIFTGLAILSNFFRNPAAIAGTFAALTDYVSRGISGDSSTFGASVHDHPSWYYLQLLAWPAVSGPWRWSEGGTLLLGVVGLVACVRGWMRGPRAWHFIAVITILLTAFYSAIPYKTPWNVLPMLTGWTFLAGRGFAAIVRWVGRVFAARRKPHLGRFAQLACAAVLMIWPALLAIQTWRATIKMPADIRNPYAYSPTSPSVFRLEKRAEQIADAAPAGHNIIIQIISPDNDYWPLPWYLRRFLHIGYYTELADASPDADIIISAVPPDDETLQRIGPRAVDFYGLRAEIMVQMLIRQPLWDAFMARAGN